MLKDISYVDKTLRVVDRDELGRIHTYAVINGSLRIDNNFVFSDLVALDKFRKALNDYSDKTIPKVFREALDAYK